MWGRPGYSQHLPAREWRGQPEQALQRERRSVYWFSWFNPLLCAVTGATRLPGISWHTDNQFSPSPSSWDGPSSPSSSYTWILCEVLNESLTTRRANGMLNASLVTSAMSSLVRLGVTVADRRRLGIVLQRTQPEDRKRISIMDNYRKALDPEARA